MTVVHLSTETIEQFIARCGSVFTNDVACRFGMDVNDARKALKKLEQEKKIISKREAAYAGAFAGSGLSWSIRDG